MVPTTASGVNASFTALQRPPTDTSDEVGQTVRRAPSRAYGHAVGMLLHHIARSHYLAKPSACLTRKQPCVPSSHVRSPDGPKHLAAAYHRRPPFESMLCRDRPCRLSSPMWSEAHLRHRLASFAPMDLSGSPRAHLCNTNPFPHHVPPAGSSENTNYSIQIQARQPSGYPSCTWHASPYDSPGRHRLQSPSPSAARPAT